MRTATKTPIREVPRSLPALGPKRLYLHLPSAYPLLCTELKWSSSAHKRKTFRLNQMGNKRTRRSRPSDAARSREDSDSFFSPSSQSPPQVLQALGPLHQFPDVRAAVLFDSEPGEFLYVTSTPCLPSADLLYCQLTFGGQQADWLHVPHRHELGMRQNYNMYATYDCQGGGMGASGHFPSTSPNGMAWQLLLLIPKSSHKGLG